MSILTFNIVSSSLVAWPQIRVNDQIMYRGGGVVEWRSTKWRGGGEGISLTGIML